MIKIIFEGWDINMKKISFTKMLKSNSHLTFKEAKSINDKLLNNEVVEVVFEDEYVAKLIYHESLKMGVKCRLSL